MAKRTYLGIHSRDKEFLKVLFSSPFGPELITFLDPDSSIELKLKALTDNKSVALVWDSEGIKVKII